MLRHGFRSSRGSSRTDRPASQSRRSLMLDPWVIHVIVTAFGEGVNSGIVKDYVFDSYQICKDFLDNSIDSSWIDLKSKVVQWAMIHYGPEIHITYECIERGTPT
jgi:hypothetical protein